MMNLTHTPVRPGIMNSLQHMPKPECTRPSGSCCDTGGHNQCRAEGAVLHGYPLAMYQEMNVHSMW